MLERIYGFAREDIARAFRAFIGLDSLRVSDVRRLHRVVDSYEGGMNFGDAMHLALSAELADLATFDEAFFRKAKRKSACRVVRPGDL